MNVALMKGIGKWLKSAYAVVSSAQTAGSLSEVSGSAIDLLGLGTKPLSGKAVLQVAATLASGETVSFAGNFQDSPTGTDQWADYGDAVAATVVCTGPSGGGAATGTFEMDQFLGGAKQYVRVQVTPSFSRTGTDTTVFSGVLVVGGADELPFDSVV